MGGNLDIINGVVDFIGKLSAPALLFVTLIIMGYGLKLLPVFPNRLIPLATLTVPMAVYPIIGNRGLVNSDFDSSSKVLWAMAMQGLIIGFAAWVSHRKVLKRLIDDKVNGALNPEHKEKKATPPETAPTPGS